MLERIEEMPQGTIGFRASGRFDVDDYRDVLEPDFKKAEEAGEFRVLLLLTDFHGLSAGAWVEDIKMGLRAWVRDHSAWKRFALVTDVEWIAKATQMFSWLTPGEVMVYGLDRLEEAKSWVAG